VAGDRGLALTRSRLAAPLALALGVLLWLAAALAGHPFDGLYGLAGLGLFGLAVFVIDRDSRARAALLDRRASATAGLVLMLAVIGGYLFEVGQGRDGWPYSWLLAMGGASYALAVLLLRDRQV
jgi:hypothetical protein